MAIPFAVLKFVANLFRATVHYVFVALRCCKRAQTIGRRAKLTNAFFARKCVWASLPGAGATFDLQGFRVVCKAWFTCGKAVVQRQAFRLATCVKSIFSFVCSVGRLLAVCSNVQNFSYGLFEKNKFAKHLSYLRKYCRISMFGD